MEYETPLFFRVMEYASQAEGDVIDMVSGNPDWEPPQALRDGLHEYADREPDAFQYPPSEGLLELREEIAARRGVDREQVVVTNGAGEANYLAMARALERDRGDEIILTDPVYPYYPGKTTMLGGTQSFVAANENGQLDPADVCEAASEETAAIVANSPNNPTGAVYPEETMRKLVAIAEEYDAVLISDEVYDHFDLSGNFSSALAVDSDHRIVTNAFSKSLAITGFRVGYAIFPPELVANAKSRHMLVNVAGSRPSQYAVLQALCGTGPDYYERNRDRLRERVDAFTDALDLTGAEYTTPEGAFYVMARFEGYPGTLENVFELIDEAGVAGMPGNAFGDSRSDWLRFALVTPRVEEAADRLAAYFE
ncbi:pyridoxal phosphate-dependent aminotransferase [Natronobacterium gregoryi]|uniref:Aspartate/tyrosine/aromatic aminotransferase n=2 Tax=Natronobacterium gregoryi TaxID=44930 RepID=L0AJJ6_NATGS|nr:pyridoxal phosphate-dependent aminotransferase [Natronobacterium gregoryi]AFZ73220.1 aspartate/tyrosine/aromatic aminotransferase [Natronobacterium gregoryi SP2]ELY71322.1 class I and II aminotransferase [Natronobacterium gregoryi SP2]PLK21627.1 pyridoxal phosphate-dependent aminotransferase [Natronobacterium gregoryi SP2]SFI58121.1 Aspartate/methionine/tyrosine aminotransferase [Natronobacterium gregoryi]